LIFLITSVVLYSGNSVAWIKEILYESKNN
jgi:hypothetical protein